MPRTTCAKNKAQIDLIKNDIQWIKKTMMGIFSAICLNIVINLLK